MAEAGSQFRRAIELEPDYDLATWNLGVLESRQAGPLLVAGQALLGRAAELNPDLLTKELAFQTDERVYRVEVSGAELELARAPGTGAAVGAAAFGAIATVGALAQLISGLGGDVKDAAETVSTQGLARATRRLRGIGGRVRLADRGWPSWAAWIPAIVVLTVTTAWTASWMAPDAFATALLIGLIAAGLALVVHTCGHLVVAGSVRREARGVGLDPGPRAGRRRDAVPRPGRPVPRRADHDRRPAPRLVGLVRRHPRQPGRGRHRAPDLPLGPDAVPAHPHRDPTWPWLPSP